MTSINAPKVIFIFRVSKIYSCLCTHVRYPRENILKDGDDKFLMTIYQRQSLKLHHGEIQGKKYQAKHYKRTDER
ncbi:MAG: hypothetical protein A2X75_01090 [Gallionellales bacterium GWE2_58_10]|nr:MAG: hypothetical protein A2X75_01090 [Gallionellales bacterium GWE2_58_10]